jgi:hypothetical protein
MLPSGVSDEEDVRDVLAPVARSAAAGSVDGSAATAAMVSAQPSVPRPGGARVFSRACGPAWLLLARPDPTRAPCRGGLLPCRRGVSVGRIRRAAPGAG